jgi:hypothetical protein
MPGKIQITSRVIYRVAIVRYSTVKVQNPMRQAPHRCKRDYSNPAATEQGAKTPAQPSIRIAVQASVAPSEEREKVTRARGHIWSPHGNQMGDR